MANETPIQDENQIVALRREKLEKIKAKRNAYPNDISRDAYANDLQVKYEGKSKEELAELGDTATVAGRVVRRGGPFVTIRDMSGTVQAYLGKQDQKESDDWQALDIGDIVSVSGVVSLSGRGQLYIEAQNPEQFRLLNKTLRPLPDKWKGLSDQEVKYRQRYVDLIVSEETRHTFTVRAKMIDGIRRYLSDNGFVEAETPMLQVIPGGATARPFITHHNAMDIDMYLRIAPELYLKRLVVGGFERVYEINRNFRNEGVSTRHNPEFTMLEFYQAYADYNDMMDHTESMLRQIANDVLGSTQLTYQEQSFDLGKPFERLAMDASVVKYNDGITLEELQTLEGVKAVAKRLNINIKPSWGWGKVLTEIFEESVEEQLAGPVFITEYPAEVSPLARRSDSNPEVTDRFEFFLGGREVANGFSELNDPIDQAQRFLAQVDEKDAGDDEAMFYDADYIRALEYGLPPTAGQGIGIDRLVMFFTDSSTIKDVILFPHMKPVDN